MDSRIRHACRHCRPLLPLLPPRRRPAPATRGVGRRSLLPTPAELVRWQQRVRAQECRIETRWRVTAAQTEPIGALAEALRVKRPIRPGRAGGKTPLPRWQSLCQSVPYGRRPASRWWASAPPAEQKVSRGSCSPAAMTEMGALAQEQVAEGAHVLASRQGSGQGRGGVPGAMRRSSGVSGHQRAHIPIMV